MAQFLKQLENIVPNGMEIEQISRNAVRILIKNASYDEKGNLTNVSFLKKISNDGRLTSMDHVLGFERIPFSKQGVNILEVMSGKQTSFWNAFPKVIWEVSYKPKNYSSSLSDKEYLEWLLNTIISFSKVTINEFEQLKNLRAERISNIEKQISTLKILVVGVGGTGSHILDSLVKEGIKNISIVDNDTVKEHNTFRFPGVPNLDLLNKPKVDYFKEIYKDYPLNIEAFNYDINDFNNFQGFDYAFVCLDNQGARSEAHKKLNENGIKFIDVGMWVDFNPEDKLTFSIRTTLGHKKSFNEAGDVGLYRTPIQINHLNSLNASIALIMFLKEMGLYADELDFAEYTVNEVNFGMEVDHVI